MLSSQEMDFSTFDPNSTALDTFQHAGILFLSVKIPISDCFGFGEFRTVHMSLTDLKTKSQGVFPSPVCEKFITAVLSINKATPLNTHVFSCRHIAARQYCQMLNLREKVCVSSDLFLQNSTLGI